MQLLEIDRQILTSIDNCRRIHDACTAGWIANNLRMSKSYIVQRCALMREAGLITWTTMPGSLKRVTPIATNTAELAGAPHNVDRSIIVDDTVEEPAGTATPTTTSTVSDRDNTTDPIKPAKGRPRKNRDLTHQDPRQVSKVATPPENRGIVASRPA